MRAGHEVLFVDRAADHVAAINRTGLEITGPIDSHTVSRPRDHARARRGRVRDRPARVKAQDTEAAARALAPHLAPDGVVVSAQNGLNERVIAEIVGARAHDRLLRQFRRRLPWARASSMYGGRGAVVVGELDGRRTPRIEALHRLMRDFDADAVLTDNIWGYLWSKLIYGALLFATALTNEVDRRCARRRGATARC